MQQGESRGRNYKMEPRMKILLYTKYTLWGPIFLTMAMYVRENSLQWPKPTAQNKLSSNTKIKKKEIINGPFKEDAWKFSELCLLTVSRNKIMSSVGLFFFFFF